MQAWSERSDVRTKLPSMMVFCQPAQVFAVYVVQECSGINWLAIWLGLLLGLSRLTMKRLV